MTSRDKVLTKYPGAESVHRRAMGRTLYAIKPDWSSRRSLGFGFTKSKAWIAAARNIALEKEPESLN